MKPATAVAPIPPTILAILACALPMLGLGPALSCADDVSAGDDVDAGTTGADAAIEFGPVPDAARDAPLDLGPPPTEPMLTVPVCEGVDTDGAVCCASALGFEDGSTQHFLPPACCRMALGSPVAVSSPTACGRGALRLTGDFRTVTAESACGQPDESLDCAYQIGDVSRAVLTSLNLTGRTVSAMVYLDSSVALPPESKDATLYVLGRGGVIQGDPVPLTQLRVWTPVEVTIVEDGNAPGADIRVIGLRVDFHGQTWLGYVYLDEITWR